MIVLDGIPEEHSSSSANGTKLMELDSNSNLTVSGGTITATKLSGNIEVQQLSASNSTPQYLLFSGGNTGYNKPRVNNNIKVNPNTGTIEATDFSGNGSSLTNINASNISSGTLDKTILNTDYLDLENNGTSGFMGETSKIKVDGFIYTEAIINTLQDGNSPSGIVFGNGSTPGSNQISMITKGDTRLYIDSSGNVGIGEKLDVSGDVSFSGDLDVGGTIIGDVSGNAATATILANTRNIGGVPFNGSANIDLPGVNETGNQNIVKTGSSLNIETTTSGAININSAAGVNITSDNTTNITSAAAVTIQSGDTHGILFKTDASGNERMRITNAGRVGIGISPSSPYMLDVSGHINFTGDLYKDGSPFSSSVWQSTGNNKIYYNTNNVGIGTTNPGEKLQVDGNIKTNGLKDIQIVVLHLKILLVIQDRQVVFPIYLIWEE